MYCCLMLPFPPTANNLFAGRLRRFPSRAYKAWREEATRALRQQRRVPRFAGRVRVTISLGRPDRRRRDVANYEKAPIDLLVAGGVLEDDSLIEEMVLRWDADVTGCRVEIEDWDAFLNRAQPTR